MKLGTTGGQAFNFAIGIAYFAVRIYRAGYWHFFDSSATGLDVWMAGLLVINMIPRRIVDNFGRTL